MREKLAEGVFLTACPDGLRIKTSRRRRSATTSEPPFQTLPTHVQDHEAESKELLRQLEPQIKDWLPFELPMPVATRGPTDIDGDIGLELELESNEHAVLLLEQEGVYRWNFGTLVETVDSKRGRRRGSRSDPGQRRMEFTIGVGRRPTFARRSRRHWITEKILDYSLGKVKAYAIKFVAGVVATGAMQYLERNVRAGMLHLTAPALDKWVSVDDLASITLPRRPQILLLIHGTFSNTKNSFAGLTAKPQSQEFLKNAIEKYDAVIGFDHRTLSETPLENAIDLLGYLEAAGWQQPQIDAIAFSRGGLVLRSLTERLLVDHDWGFRRAVLVACTNGGTQLAEPDNWESLIDFSTNLAMAGSRVMGLLAGPTAVPAVLGPVVKNLGAFAKYLATTSINDRKIPGLAAMEPDGDFIRSLNDLQAGASNSTPYYVITSNFDRKLFQSVPATALPKHLLGVLADRFTDTLMGVDNDLVVDVPSMTAIDSQIESDVYNFGSNGEVYHTVYFFQPATIACLHNWLEVPGEVRATRGTHRAEARETLEEIAKQPILEISTTRVRPSAVEKEREYKGPRINIKVHWGDITQLDMAECGILAVGHYNGLLPQRAERALDELVSDYPKRRDAKEKTGDEVTDDARLVLTQQTRRGVLHGHLGDIDLFPVPRQPYCLVAVCGMGYQSEFDELRLRIVYRSLLSEVGRLPNRKVLSTILIGSGDGGVSLEAAVKMLVTGFGEAIETIDTSDDIDQTTFSVVIVEQAKSKADKILKAFKELKRSKASYAWMDDVDELVIGKGGHIDDCYVVKGLEAGVKEALKITFEQKDLTVPQKRKTIEYKAVEQILTLGLHDINLTPAKNRSQVKRALKSLERQELDAQELGNDRREERQEKNERKRDYKPAHRISILHDGKVFRIAAITNTTTMPERILGVDRNLIKDATKRLTDPLAADVVELGAAMTRLIWHREFQRVLDSSAPLVVEVDRETAAIHLEMCLSSLHNQDRKPIGLCRHVARQIRTTYSPPPMPEERRTSAPKVLVIGDPGNPDLGEDLPGARREAIQVVDLLSSMGFDVTGLIGAPGTELPFNERVVDHAERFDVARYLLSGEFDIVHYCGHCSFDPDDPSRVGWLFSGGMLTSREIENMERAPMLVVANACFSSRTSERMSKGKIKNAYDEAALLPTLADEFFRRGVRNYIGTAWPVHDVGAVRFASKFYGAFVHKLDPPDGDCIGEAMLKARTELHKLSRKYEALWAAYQHYGDPGFTIRDITRGS